MDYRGSLFGYFDKGLDRVSFIYTAYIKTDVIMNDEGIYMDEYTEIDIQGSLQAFTKSQTYSSDGVNFSSRDGKFWCKYNIELNEGDIIKKNNTLFQIKEVTDYDFHGVRVYNLTRLGIDEGRTLLSRAQVNAKHVTKFKNQVVGGENNG